MNFMNFMGFIEDLNDGDPMKAKGEKIGELFTRLVEVLRNPEHIPNPEITNLMNLTYRLVGTRQVPAAMMEDVPTIHFLCMKTTETEIAMFCVPEDWPEQCVQNRIEVAGGLVWASSQCRDFWNNRLIMDGKENVLNRAYAYEAEFLLTVKEHEALELNDRQTQLLENFPKGIQSVPELLYSPLKPFMDAF